MGCPTSRAFREVGRHTVDMVVLLVVSALRRVDIKDYNEDLVSGPEWLQPVEVI
jgi:hypothetical protein